MNRKTMLTTVAVFALAGAAQTVCAQDAEPAVAADATSLKWSEGWEGSAEVGLNGTSGNTERLNVRAGAGMDRRTEETETALRIIYSFAKEDGDTTEEKARVSLRNDWLLNDSPWRIWAEGVYDYDHKTEWDHRISLRAGAGYTFIDDGKYFLLGRVGVGATKNLFGSVNEWRPEGVLGGDFRWDIKENHKFAVSADFFPALDEFGDYRAEINAAYEIVLDAESNMSLKLGLLDRYDSRPAGGDKRNDIDYFALLAWTF